jgi:hypothetical protein
MAMVGDIVARAFGRVFDCAMVLARIALPRKTMECGFAALAGHCFQPPDFDAFAPVNTPFLDRRRLIADRYVVGYFDEYGNDGRAKRS